MLRRLACVPDGWRACRNVHAMPAGCYAALQRRNPHLRGSDRNMCSMQRSLRKRRDVRMPGRDRVRVQRTRQPARGSLHGVLRIERVELYGVDARVLGRSRNLLWLQR